MERINIEGLEIFARHGVLEKEKADGQKFYIDACLVCDTNAAARDDIADAADYSSVCEFLYRYLTSHRFNLIETAAARAARALMIAFPKIREADLTLHKPEAPVKQSVRDISVSVTQKWNRAYLSTGSNMGDREGYLKRAADAFYDDGCCRVLKVSRVIETAPYGPVQQDDFLNACLEIETLYDPFELLEMIHQTEDKAGRTRNVRWGPRTLDIDILLYGQEVICENNLIIPHPQMQKRQFVLEPLSQIAPYAFNPVLQKTAARLLEELRTADGNDAAGSTPGACCEGCAGFGCPAGYGD